MMRKRIIIGENRRTGHVSGEGRRARLDNSPKKRPQGPEPGYVRGHVQALDTETCELCQELASPPEPEPELVFCERERERKAPLIRARIVELPTRLRRWWGKQANRIFALARLD